MKERVIGIIGGMGSFATLDFFKRVLLHYPAEKEWERPRIIVDNYCTMPSRVRAILYHENEERLIGELTDSIINLVKVGCTDIILVCNTSHYFLNKILSANLHLQNFVINMIEVCVSEIVKSKINEIYLIASEGTIDVGIYINDLQKKGIRVQTPNERELKEIRRFIEAVKQNKVDEIIKDDFLEFINSINCNNVLLGCTEIPILYNSVANKIHKIAFDPLTSVLNELDKRA